MSNLALSMCFVESCHWYTIAWNTKKHPVCLLIIGKHRDSFYDLNGNIISSAHMISDTYINIIHWLDVQRRVGNWYMISSLSFILIISPEPHSILLLAPTYIPVSNMLDSPPRLGQPILIGFHADLWLPISTWTTKNDLFIQPSVVKVPLHRIPD